MKIQFLFEIINIIQPIKIYHFGNRGKAAKDVDLLIISDYFVGVSIFKRRELIQLLNPDIDPICLTKQQFEIFNRCKGSLYHAIKANAVVIYEV